MVQTSAEERWLKIDNAIDQFSEYLSNHPYKTRGISPALLALWFQEVIQAFGGTRAFVDVVLLDDSNAVAVNITYFIPESPEEAVWVAYVNI